MSDEEPFQAKSSNPILEDIESDKTDTKLRGDAIGDTMYSETFVLRTLMKFSELTEDDLTQDYEEDLCFLWDMTQESEVCEYLIQHSYPSLVSTALEKTNNTRTIEIVIGIFANILCSQPVQISLEDDVIIDTLNASNTLGPLVLLQIMRFINGLIFKNIGLHIIKSSKEILDKIQFILENSTNEDLLLYTLKVLALLLEDGKIDQSIFNNESILRVSITAYDLLTKNGSDYHKDAANFLLQVSCNLCYYINKGDAFLNDSENESLLLLTLRIVNLYGKLSSSEIPTPIPDEVVFFPEASLFLFESLNLKYKAPLLHHLFDILSSIIEKENEDNLELIHKFVDFLFHFLNSNSVDVKTEIPNIDKNKLKNILRVLEENEVEFSKEISFLKIIYRF